MLSRLPVSALIAVISFLSINSVWATPIIEKEPDFYSAPGANSQRNYDFSDNLAVDTFSGTLQSHVTDLVIPGIGPDIVVSRSYNSVPGVLSEFSYMGPGWDMHFGRIVGSYFCSEDILSRSSSLFYIKPDGAQVEILSKNLISLGNNVSIGAEVSIGPDISAENNTDFNYKPDYINSEMWRAECRGDQLVLSNTRGTHFFFGKNSDSLAAMKHVVVAVEDSYGNQLSIEYQLFNTFLRPISVEASDGRKLSITYIGNKLDEVKGSRISVGYKYSGEHLASVDLPEGLKWTYEYKDSTRLLSNIITPLGAKIDVDWDNVFFYDKDYPVVKQKCVESACWKYAYSRSNEGANPLQDVTTIETPYGTTEKYRHYNSKSALNPDGENRIWQVGLLKKKEIYRGSSTRIYSIENQWESVPFSGHPHTYTENGVRVGQLRRLKPFLKSYVEERYGAKYTYEVLDYSAIGLPLITEREGNATLIEKNQYFSQGEAGENWFLGIPKSKYIHVPNEGYKLVTNNEFNENGSIIQAIEPGKVTSYAYYSDGTLRSVTDGEGNKTEYSNYHRGVAQLINFPDGSEIRRQVDHRGRITSKTDQMGSTTYYTYDDLDRVTLVELPFTDNVTVSYSHDNRIRTFTKGALVEKYFYDELGNLVKHSRSDGSKEYVQVYRYDVQNRLIFSSNVNQPSYGIRYSYNKLGDLISTTKVSSEAEEETTFLYSSNKKIITDPKGNITTQYFDTFSADDHRLSRIEGPEGLDIVITRNKIGSPLTVAQGDLIRTYEYDVNWMLRRYLDPEADAEYVYTYDRAGRLSAEYVGLHDSDTQLKRHVVDYTYDPMGRVDEITYSTRYLTHEHPWSLFVPDVCLDGLQTSCAYTSFADSYDFEYDKNGNLTRKRKFTYIDWWADWGIRSETKWSLWEYDYDRENNLRSETLNHFGRKHSLHYDYDSMGNLATVTYPDQFEVSFQPDAFGRPTMALPVISEVKYHDNGALSQLTYSDASTVSYTLDARNRVGSMTGPDIELKYSYDSNDNLTKIDSNLFGNKTMGYDGLDRLDSSTGQWGVASYDYDSFQNIILKQVGSKDFDYVYDSRNRLSRFSGQNIHYDLYGRIIHDGVNRYYYDFNNNLLKASPVAGGDIVEFEYDSNHRMAKRIGSTVDHTVYSSAGKLMYEDQRYGDLTRSHIYVGSKLVGYHETRVDCDQDYDLDGMPHCFERDHGLDPSRNDGSLDADGDGVSNYEEYTIGTDPRQKDTDSDGMDDGIELEYGFNPVMNDANADPDLDGLSNIQELALNTNPNLLDTDGDKLDDGLEIQYGLNPLRSDANGDFDGDGLTNIEEFNLGTDFSEIDTDSDGMDDRQEFVAGLDPLKADAYEDNDGDGFINVDELKQGSNPNEYTDLMPVANFNAEFDGLDSTVIYWASSQIGVEYDLYWADQPFESLASANVIPGIAAPFQHKIDRANPSYYYRLVSKNARQEIDASPVYIADIVDKSWHFIGETTGKIEGIDIDGSGNGFLLKNINITSASDQPDVLYWNQATQELKGYEIFDDISEYKSELSVSHNGYAMVLVSLFDARKIYAATFSPFTKQWEVHTVWRNHDSYISQDGLGVVAAANGVFAVTWWEKNALYSRRKVRTWNPVHGWSNTFTAQDEDSDSGYSGYNADSKNFALSVDDEGVVSLLSGSFLKENGSDTVSYGLHLYTFLPDGEKRITNLGVNTEPSNLSVSNIQSGRGVMTWATNQGYFAQRFSVGGELGTRETIQQQSGTSSATVLTSKNKAVLFLEQSEKVYVYSQEDGGSWSAQADAEYSFEYHSGLLKKTINAGLNGSANAVFNKNVLIQSSTGNQILPSSNEGTNFKNYAISTLNMGGMAMRVDTRSYSSTLPLYLYQSKPVAPNVPPVAVTIGDIKIRNRDDADIHLLDSSGSYDADGAISNISWKKTKGPSVGYLGYFSKTSDLPPTNPAAFEFELTVTDDKGATDVDSFQLVVDSSLSLPVAHAEQGKAVHEGDLVQLDASLSGVGADIPVERYEWAQVDGPAVILSDSNGVNPTFVAPDVTSVERVHLVLATYTAKGVYTSTDEIFFDVYPIGEQFNSPPIVRLKQEWFFVDAGDKVTLDYSRSYDPDGGEISVAFKTYDSDDLPMDNLVFTPGGDAGTVEFTVPHVSEETYFYVSVIVTDDEGDSEMREIEVDIQPSGRTAIDNGFNLWRNIDVDLGSYMGASYGVMNHLTPRVNEIQGLLTSRGEETSVNLLVTSPFTGSSNSGSSADPWELGEDVVRDSLYLGGGSHSEMLGRAATLTFENLDPAGFYDLFLYASQAGSDSGRGRLTRYTVNDHLYRDLEVADNEYNRIAFFANVQPKADGTLTLDVHVSPDGASRYASLGFVSIDHVTSAEEYPSVMELLPLQFGEVPVGQTAQQTLTLMNFGIVPAEIDQITPAGPDTPLVTISNDSCSNTTLQVAASCTLVVTYSPANADYWQGVLVSHNRVVRVDVMGTGIEALPPGSNGFPVGNTLQVDIGGTGYPTTNFNNLNPHETSVANLTTTSGDQTEVGIEITTAFSGNNSSGSSSNNLGLPASVSRDTQWVNATQVATVTLSNLSPTSQYQLTLFASRSGNDSGRGRLTRYTVNGGQYQDLDASDNTSNHVEFNNLVPAADGTVRLDVAVSPDGSGRYGYLGYLAITHVSEGGDPPPQKITLNTSSVEFGDININESQQQVVTVTNDGDQDLALAQLEIAGSDSANFSLVNDSCSNMALGSGVSCNVTLVFTPIEMKNHQASLVVPSDDPSTSEVTVALSGAGIETTSSGGGTTTNFPVGSTLQIDVGGSTYPTSGWNNLNPGETSVAGLNTSNGDRTPVGIEITTAFSGDNSSGSTSNNLGLPATVSRDTLWVNATQVATVTLSNLSPTSQYQVTLFASRSGNDSGRGRLTRYTLNGNQYGELDASNNTDNYVEFANVVPAADGTLRLDVAVSPDGTGRYGYLGYLAITHVSEGGDPPAQQINMSTTSLEFGIKNLDTPHQQTVTVSNGGGQDLTLGQLQLGGSDSGSFRLLGDGCSDSTLGAGGSCSLDIAFTPNEVKAYQANLLVPSDDPANPNLSITLSGNGIDGSAIDPSGFDVGAKLEIDFGGGNYTTAGLNNINAAQSQVDGLMTQSASVTNVSAALTAAFSGTNTSGSTSNTLGLPANSSRDSLYLTTGNEAILVLDNLNPTNGYDLTLFASRNGNDAGRGRLTRYTINGSQYQDLDASSNTSNAVQFNNISPDANGRITLHIQISPDGTARYGYLGYLAIVNRGAK